MEKRLSFDSVPEIYDRARPSYPEPLFDELFAYLGVAEPAIVEVGPGTGQATRSLLERGARVTAVEIGPDLAAFLGRKFAAAADQLNVVNSSFEDAVLPKASFDAVVSATAFHWVEPAIRLRKSCDLLRPQGVLAIIGTNQIASDADRGFFNRVFPVYQKYFPNEEQSTTPGEDVVPPEFAEVESSGLFVDVMLRRYRWDQTYSTEAYADLMRSYSNMQLMEPSAREQLIADVCSVIDWEYGSFVTRPLVITLTIGRRR